MSDLSEMDGGLIAPWKFCSRGETTEDINIQKLVEEIGSNYTYCKEKFEIKLFLLLILYNY